MVPLRKDTLVLICHPQHPLAKSKSIKLSQLAGQKFIGFEPDIPTRKAIDKVFKDHDVAVETVMEFDNIETVKRAVEIDAGISLVPQGTITPGSGQANPGGSENRRRGPGASAGGDLQEEQSPLARHETVHRDSEGIESVLRPVKLG